MFLTRK